MEIITCGLGINYVKDNKLSGKSIQLSEFTKYLLESLNQGSDFSGQLRVEESCSFDGDAFHPGARVGFLLEDPTLRNTSMSGWWFLDDEDIKVTE